MANKNFTITIDKLGQGGLTNQYWKEEYRFFGNANQLSDCTSIDLTDPDFIYQGAGLATLTNGSQAGNVQTLIKGISKNVVASDSIYGVGGASLYPISSTTVSTAHTINHPSKTSEDGEDVALYSGELFYSYNHNTGGDIGKYDLSSTYDDDWWTDTAGGDELEDAPHQMVVAGTSGVIFIANGQYVATWNGTTATADDFDTKDDDNVISSVQWANNRLYISANKPNVTGNNRNEASIYIWDGNDVSWESQVKINGRVGALFTHNNTVYVFYQENVSEGVITLGVTDGYQIREVEKFEGTLPEYYQISEYKGFTIFASGQDIFAFGSSDTRTPTRLFKLSQGKYTTSGGLTNAFGTPMIASNATTNYDLSKFSGYSTDATCKTTNIDVTIGHRDATIKKVIFNFEKLATNARVDVTFKDNKGTSLETCTISHTTLGAVTQYIPTLLFGCENLRMELDYSNGDTTNTVKLRSIILYGTTREQ
jgi:hypothetical protein